jgi:hypothetical protein
VLDVKWRFDRRANAKFRLAECTEPSVIAVVTSPNRHLHMRFSSQGKRRRAAL